MNRILHRPVNLPDGLVDKFNGVGGMTVEERNQAAAFGTAILLLGGGIYAGLKGYFLLGGLLAVSAPLVGGLIRAQGTKPSGT